MQLNLHVPMPQRSFLCRTHGGGGIMYATNGEGDAKQRKRLTPDIRNAILRDLVSTMFT